MQCLMDVLRGTAQLESIQSELVTGAVRETIQKIAAKYDLDPRQLSEEFEQDIIDRYSAVTAMMNESDSRRAREVVLCAGTTKAGQPCPHSATCGKFCKKHIRHAQQDETKRRKVEAYAASMKLNTANKENVQPLPSQAQALTAEATTEQAPPGMVCCSQVPPDDSVLLFM